VEREAFQNPTTASDFELRPQSEPFWRATALDAPWSKFKNVQLHTFLKFARSGVRAIAAVLCSLEFFFVCFPVVHGEIFGCRTDRAEPRKTENRQRKSWQNYSAI
jgi:hypothetical protein